MATVLSNLVVLLAAPSGGGKTTVCQRLLAADARLARAITSTTRPPRVGEQTGVDYHFYTRDDFTRRLAAGAFLEHATVHSNLYGLERAELNNQWQSGRDVLLNMDVQGADTLRARAREDTELARALVTIFLAPPSMQVLRDRLSHRGTDSQEVIERRLAAARGEIEHWPKFDYIVVSASIEEDVRRMQVILETERMRAARSRYSLATS